MQLTPGFLAVALAVALPVSSRAQLYVSPNDDGVPGSDCIGIGAGDQSLYLWVDDGSTPTDPASAACDGTGGTTPGDEICLFDFNVGAGAGLTIVSFAAEPEADIVDNALPERLRMNGGNALTGTLGPNRVGELVVSASAVGNLTIEGEAVVDTTLTANPTSGVLASSGLDFDTDTLCDIEDPCPVTPNPLPIADANSDGIPDECQCGDANDDGLIGFDDATCLGQCFITGGTAGPPCNCSSGKADTNNDGLWGFDDATNVAQAFIGGIPQQDLTCAKRPVGGPVP